MNKEKLEKILALMPQSPGVYLMKNRVDEIIYIGKSRALKKRVKSYFTRNHDNLKTAVMVSAIENIEFIVTANEVEALILENNLIKKHRPRYNILLKDSKTHPYVRVTLKEKYPRLEKVRRVVFKDGNLYFGPFPNAYDLNRILDLLSRTYRLCTSAKKLPENRRPRPCLKYHLGLCQGVCQGQVAPEVYRESINKAIDVLSGKSPPDFSELERQLKELTDAYRYEEAAELRDTIVALHRFFENQKVEFVKPVNSDIWGLSETPDRVVFSVFFIRSGKLLGNRIIDVEKEPGADSDQVLASMMTRFYDRNLIPALIYSSKQPEGAASLKELLSRRSGRKVAISVPARGQFRHLAKMADTNALEVLKNIKTDGLDRISEGVLDLQNRLQLKKAPVRIECIDISHIQGVDPVASLVVSVNGAPKKGDYRLFHIKSAMGGDDPASIGEVVRRRVSRLLNEGKELPDLLIVDGGITQVRAAEKELEKLDAKIELLGLAKREELLVSSDGSERKLPFSSPGMKIIIKLRNEAHRFANNFQKKTHTRRLVRSSLLNLPGVGPAVLRKVLWAFGSTEKVARAGAEEVQKLTGIPMKTAQIIVEALKNENV
jgi:excinuclease ABC subunit C